MAVTGVVAAGKQDMDNSSSRVSLGYVDTKTDAEWERVMGALTGEERELLLYFANVIRLGGHDQMLAREEQLRAEMRELGASRKAADAANPGMPKVFDVAKAVSLIAAASLIVRSGQADNVFAKGCELGASAFGSAKNVIEPRYQGAATQAQNKLRVVERDVQKSLGEGKRLDDRGQSALRSLDAVTEKDDSKKQGLR